MSASCPFCTVEPARIFFEDATVVALWDAYPVALGHALVIPRRHIASWFDATDDERIALMRGTERARDAIMGRQPADGFNVGVNIGEAAGQTVMHLHMHVIPRRHGDVTDPRGGVRWVLPERADYWSTR